MFVVFFFLLPKQINKQNSSAILGKELIFEINEFKWNNFVTILTSVWDIMPRANETSRYSMKCKWSNQTCVNSWMKPSNHHFYYQIYTKTNAINIQWEEFAEWNRTFAIDSIIYELLVLINQWIINMLKEFGLNSAAAVDFMFSVCCLDVAIE